MINDELKTKLINTISRGKVVAQGGLILLRKQILFATLCAVWISYYLYDLFSLSSNLFFVLFVILSLPTLIFLLFYYLLSEVKDLDEVVKESYGDYRERKDDYKKKIKKEEKVKFLDFIKFGRDFGKIYFAIKGESDLIDSFQSIAFLANPIFLILLVGAFAVTLFYILLSIVTALFFIF